MTQLFSVTVIAVLAGLVGIAAAQSILPANSTSPLALTAATPVILRSGPTLAPHGSLYPLNDVSESPTGLMGKILFSATPDTVNNISNVNIAYVTCDPDAYSAGQLDASFVLTTAISHNVAAVLFYSTTSTFCTFTEPNPHMSSSLLYSMTNPTVSASVLSELQSSSPAILQLATISTNTTAPGNSLGGNDSSQTGGTANPSGPSPSSSVAMVILYTITGVISALFLVIITTGAVRAHRNPERYGPQNVHGRPRQSRAKGIARAMLETLPIVKFGERDQQPKPTDVELAGSKNVQANNDSNYFARESQTEVATTTHAAGESRPSADCDYSGIAPAEQQLPPAAVPTAAKDGEDEDAVDGTAKVPIETGTGCSICTDDFEKGEDIRVLPCSHSFHPACIDPWLLNVSGTCPLCRNDLRPVTSQASDAAGAGAAAGRDGQAATAAGSENAGGADGATGSAGLGETRRRSMLHDILLLRRIPQNSSTTEAERQAALIRLREQRPATTGGGHVGSQAEVEGGERSRRQRFSALLGGGRRVQQ